LEKEMGQFKPMVKMMTNEPSVILKLKKGGKVQGHSGFKGMHHTASNPFAAAEAGRAPKKPSLSERRRAMNPNMYANGGKVAHKQYGGAMPMPAAPAAPMGAAPMAPMSRQAVMGMDPRARAARAAAVRRAIAGMRGGMKKGGKASADCAKLERELEHHKSMSASKAHGKASGGNVSKFAKTKMDTAKRDTAHGTGDVKEGKPGGYKAGGTIEGNEKSFENTKMVSAGKGKTGGSTGGVRMSNAGGYKHGGNAVMKADGGSIKGGNWENRPANTSKPGVKNTKTGEVKEANAGGYRKGGAAKKA
jgi:hypothetical protein